MAKVLLKIGYQQFLLPNEKGVMTVINTLSGGMQVEEDIDSLNHRARIFVEVDREMSVSVSLLTAKDVVRRLHRKALPNRAGPDADGNDIFKRD